MKKILVLLLALVLCVCTLASCDVLNTIKGYIPGLGEETTPVEETPAAPTYDIDAAVTYVYNLYKNKSITGADFDVTAVVAIKNAKYTVTYRFGQEDLTYTLEAGESELSIPIFRLAANSDISVSVEGEDEAYTFNLYDVYRYGKVGTSARTYLAYHLAYTEALAVLKEK